MSQTVPATGLQLRSLVTKDGKLELSLAEVAVPEPGPDDVVIQIEATPINPSDLGLLVGGADMRTAYVTLSDSGCLGVMQWPEPGLKLNFA